jgi:hypothetical protein
VAAAVASGSRDREQKETERRYSFGTHEYVTSHELSVGAARPSALGFKVKVASNVSYCAAGFPPSAE